MENHAVHLFSKTVEFSRKIKVRPCFSFDGRTIFICHFLEMSNVSKQNVNFLLSLFSRILAPNKSSILISCGKVAPQTIRNTVIDGRKFARNHYFSLIHLELVSFRFLVTFFSFILGNRTVGSMGRKSGSGCRGQAGKPGTD